MNYNTCTCLSQKLFFLALLTSVALNLSMIRPAQAGSHVDRCNGDPGYPDQARRRVAWALKCNIISQRIAEFYNELEQYPTFEIPGRPMYLWFDEHAPCFRGAKMIGSCAAVGCFAENTRLLFPEGYQTLKDAELDGKKKIISLGEGSAYPSTLTFSPAEIEFYMSGQTKETLVEISTPVRRIWVTNNHPMVLAGGSVVSANELSSGNTMVATVDGPEEVTSLRSVAYDGEAWNVRVRSEKARANIHVAEGFLTGGLRYQNKWTDAFSRRLERIRLNSGHDL